MWRHPNPATTSKNEFQKKEKKCAERIQSQIISCVFLLAKIHSAAGHQGLMRNRAVYLKQVNRTET